MADQTFGEVQELIDQISFQDWVFDLEEEGDHYVLQIVFDAPDRETGEEATQYCRKWRISRWATDTEIVNTAFLAVRVAMEHEIREAFTWRGSPLYGPHVAIDALAGVADDLDVR